MTIVFNFFAKLFNFLQISRDEHLKWKLSRQAEAFQLRQTRLLSEQNMLAELKKQAQQIAHELEISKTKNANELAMVRIHCQQDLKDYQQYLQSLDKLKDSLRTTYKQMPEAVAFTIHHHAKQLLNQMWEAQDNQEKLKHEMHLLEFMTAVHEDNFASLRDQGAMFRPEKALAMIETKLEAK